MWLLVLYLQTRHLLKPTKLGRMCPETQRVSVWGPGPKAAAPGNLLEMQIPGPTQACGTEGVWSQ